MPHPARIDTPTILAASRDLLEAHGQEGVTMRELARRLGVRAPSLYFHVASREQVLMGLIGVGLEELGEALHHASTTGEPRAIAHAMVDAYLDFAGANPHLFSLIFGPCPVEGPLFTAGEDRASVALLRAAAQLASPAEAIAVGQVLWSLVHGFTTLLLAGQFRLPGDPRAALHDGLDALLDGLAVANRTTSR